MDAHGAAPLSRVTPSTTSLPWAFHLNDPRCEQALDRLESKQLPDGGWRAESKYYSVSHDIKLNADYVDWGGTSKKRMNPWVTAQAYEFTPRSALIGAHLASTGRLGSVMQA